MNSLWIDLSCPACQWGEVLGRPEVVQRLRSSGMLKRSDADDDAELCELLIAAAAKWPCPTCGGIGLAARHAVDEEQDWPQARACKECGRPISAERLEALPDAVLCAACQRGEESGTTGAEDYCPRCGKPMTLRLSRAGGISRYALVCADWPQCRGKAIN